MQNLTPEILASIRAVVDYNWADELEDAQDVYAEVGGIDGHVFCDLVRLDNMLRGVSVPAEDYLDKSAD